MKISLPDFFFSVDLLALSLSNKTNSQMFFFFFMFLHVVWMYDEWQAWPCLAQVMHVCGFSDSE